MTTPAIDYNVLRTEFTQQQTRTDCAGNVTVDASSSDGTTRYVKHRPISSNSPKQSSGFRLPTAYYHWGYKATAKVTGRLNAWQVGLCADPHQRTYITNYNMQGLSMDSAVHIPFLPTWLMDQATTKAYGKLKNQLVNVGVAFAERHETAELFSQTAKRIGKAVNAYKKTRPKDWAKVLAHAGRREGKNIPGSWLELQYGWNPLMADVQGACQALSKKEKDPSSYHVHVTGKSSTSEVSAFDLDYAWLENGLAGQRITVTNSFQATVRLWYRLAHPLLATFSSLGLTNPLEIVWERVPYSFVVDWFIPVGGWLSTLDADYGWEFLAGCSTGFTRVQAKGYPITQFFSGPFTHGVENLTSPYSFEGFEMNRGLLSSPPGVGLPHFKNPFSAGHIANALSLLVQAFR